MFFLKAPKLECDTTDSRNSLLPPLIPNWNVFHAAQDHLDEEQDGYWRGSKVLDAEQPGGSDP